MSCQWRQTSMGEKWWITSGWTPRVRITMVHIIMINSDVNSLNTFTLSCGKYVPRKEGKYRYRENTDGGSPK